MIIYMIMIYDNDASGATGHAKASSSETKNEVLSGIRSSQRAVPLQLHEKESNRPVMRAAEWLANGAKVSDILW
jgi:hypothetical protein